MHQLIITRRGIVDISDVLIGDEVYTAKKRWRRVEAKAEIKTNWAFKHRYSLWTPVCPAHVTPPRQPSYKNRSKLYPLCVPSDVNLDNNPLSYWQSMGDALNKVTTSKLSIYEANFKIPMPILTLNYKKIKAFLKGLFEGPNPIDMSRISMRARLGLSILSIKSNMLRNSKGMRYIDGGTFRKDVPHRTVILKVAEDRSYCVNGTFVKIKYDFQDFS
jgi:hypothetical protein